LFGKLINVSKRKVFNDPVHGFISIPHNFLFEIIEHRYFQRLRRIKQLALTEYVYPGALHTRFHHALGAFYLMGKAIFVLRQKGHEITLEEEEGALAAILLHDIGHGPFSHTLEKCLIKNVSHEAISSLYMQKLNEEFDGKLDLAIQIFQNKYHKPFLYQLVSSQLDVDRLDYLTRDSFFTGVSEGVVNYNRIIDMIDVKDGNLVVEAKGIYSIEKFLISRRLMYWQVYLHKTVVCAEEMLIKVLERARELSQNGVDLKVSAALHYFLDKNIDKEYFMNNSDALEQFSQLDDYDIISAVKSWINHPDSILSFLSNSIIYRKLFKIKVLDNNPSPEEIKKLQDKIQSKLNLTTEQTPYYVFFGKMTNHMYNPKQLKINILQKNGKVIDMAEASDQWNMEAFAQVVSKYYLCYPKNID
jgi:HD superfamily phosphohydrolase